MLPALTAFAVISGDNNGIIGSSMQSLNGQWGLANANGSVSIKGSVPGDLITDLELAGVIGDPLYELNFKTPVWDHGNWTYTLNFTAEDTSAAHSWLVFQGIKMVADISLNGQAVGFAADQFLRYAFDVTGIVKLGAGNTLTVTFPTYSDARNSEERWMSCSGGVRACFGSPGHLQVLERACPASCHLPLPPTPRLSSFSGTGHLTATLPFLDALPSPRAFGRACTWWAWRRAAWPWSTLPRACTTMAPTPPPPSLMRSTATSR